MAEKCVICLKNMRYAKKDKIYLKKCNHKYCEKCILEWYNNGQYYYELEGKNWIKYSKCPQCRTPFEKTDIIIEDVKNWPIKKLDIYKRTRKATRIERCNEVYMRLRELLNEIELTELSEEKIKIAIKIFKYLYKNKWFLKKGSYYESGIECEVPMFKRIINKKLNEFMKIDKRFNEWEYKLRESLK